LIIEHGDHLLSQFFSSVLLPLLVPKPYSLKLYFSSLFYIYSSLLDDLLLVEVLKTELVVGDYDFYTSCSCCRRYSVLWNSLCVDTSTSSAAIVTRVEPSSHADSLCYSPFNKSFAVTLPVDKSLIMSYTAYQMTVVILL